MTAEQLLTAYPDCQQAVAWVELIICQNEPDTQTTWELMMSARPPVTLDVAIELLRHAVNDEEGVGRWREAHNQMLLPSFRKYLAGKMGLM